MSPKIQTRVTISIGVVLLVFGLACLNYTAAEGRDHHREFAARYGLPGPSKGIQYGGLLSLVVGAAMIGYGLGRRQTIPG